MGEDDGRIEFESEELIWKVEIKFKGEVCML